MKIPVFVNRVISKIEDSGFEAFVVGGCVRDSLLMKEPSDWDITTSASPECIQSIFGSAEAIPTGIKHGTVTVITEEKPIEVTTYRIDGEYRDNRRPERVIFSRSLCEDLQRRDFTINAMAFSPKTGITDLFGGRADLSAGLIRCVGDPEKRFREDALRIMRALRLAAVLDFKIEEATAAALHKLFPLLKNIAAERIMSELNKLLGAENPHNILCEYSDVLLFILGKPECCNIWNENLKALSNTPRSLELRLAALLRGFESPSAVLKALKYDNKTRHTVAGLISLSALNLPETKADTKKILSHCGEEMFGLFVQLKNAVGEPLLSINKVKRYLSEIEKNNECYTLKQLAVTGRDLQKHFSVQGRRIGEILDTLLEAVICESCINEHDALLEFAKLHIKI